MEPKMSSEEALAEVLKGEFGEQNYESVNDAYITDHTGKQLQN